MRYSFDPGASRLTVQAFATGVLSVFGHSPTFVARELAGSLRLDAGAGHGPELDLTVPVDSLELEGRASATDRDEIVGRMRREVLDSATYPEIAFRATDVASETVVTGHYRVRLGGPLSLHGVTRHHVADAELLLFEDGLHLRGGCPLRLSDYGIRPVTALGGAIALKDELRLSFDLVGRLEGP